MPGVLAWRRALARIGRWAPSLPQLAAGGAGGGRRGRRAVVARATANARRAAEPELPTASLTASVVKADDASRAARLPERRCDRRPRMPSPPSVTSTYGDAAEELLALAIEARVAVEPPTARDAFDAHVAELRGEIARAAEGRPRQRAWRGLIRYLQNAVVRDEIALAGGGAVKGASLVVGALVLVLARGHAGARRRAHAGGRRALAARGAARRARDHPARRSRTRSATSRSRATTARRS